MDEQKERNAFANSENYNHPQTFEEIQASEHQAQMPEYPSQMSDQMVQGKSRKYTIEPETTETEQQYVLKQFTKGPFQYLAVIDPVTNKMLSINRINSWDPQNQVVMKKTASRRIPQIFYDQRRKKLFVKST